MPGMNLGKVRAAACQKRKKKPTKNTGLNKVFLPPLFPPWCRCSIVLVYTAQYFCWPSLTSSQ